MNSLKLISILSFVFIPISCFGSGIPTTMPDDFSIVYSYQNGRGNAHKKIELKIGDCLFESDENFDDNVIRYSFILTKEELAALYNALKDINAFKLKSKKQTVHDRGGDSITYLIKGQQYVANNHGSNFIIKPHINHFNESIDLITACADRHKP